MKATYNPVTKRMEFPKVVKDAKGKEKAVVTDAFVAVPLTTISKLVAFAKEDGADLKAESDRGKKAKETGAARTYILALIDGYIAERSKKAK
jgi:hypothetical protein